MSRLHLYLFAIFCIFTTDSASKNEPATDMTIIWNWGDDKLLQNVLQQMKMLSDKVEQIYTKLENIPKFDNEAIQRIFAELSQINTSNEKQANTNSRIGQVKTNSESERLIRFANQVNNKIDHLKTIIDNYYNKLEEKVCNNNQELRHYKRAHETTPREPNVHPYGPHKEGRAVVFRY